MNIDSDTPEKKHTKEPDTDIDDDSTEETTNEKTSGKSTNDKRGARAEKAQRRASFFAVEDQAEKTEKASSFNLFEKQADRKNDDTTTESTESDAEESNETEEIQEGLSESEVHEAVEAIIDTRNDELEIELQETEQNSPEELEVLANAAFLASLQERINTDNEFTDESIEEAFRETLHDLQLEEMGTDNPSLQESPEAGTDETVMQSAEETAEDTVPSGPSGPNFYYPLNQNRSTLNTRPNRQAQQNNVVVEYIDRRQRGRDLLVGGIVGYILGRRGGRKRTEKKLNPKIEYLEKEVSLLHDRISEREDEIRKQVREFISIQYKADTEKKQLEEALSSTAKSYKKNNPTVTKHSNNLIVNRQKRAEVKETLLRREELAEKEAVEKLKKFTLPALEVFRERRLPDGNENSPKRKPVEIMTVPELMEQIGNLRFNGDRVVDLFEQNRINEASLRQVTKEYLRSGPYEKTLMREIKPDPNELAQHRDSIEKVHNQNGYTPPSKTLSKESEQAKYGYNQTTNVTKTSKKSSKQLSQQYLVPTVVVIVILIVIASLLFLAG